MNFQNDECRFKLSNFDKTTLAEIFSNLDVKSLIQICYTSEHFNEVVSSSKSLMKKLKFTIKLLDNTGEVVLNVNDITRPYQNLKIENLKEQLIENRKSLRKQFEMLISKIASKITLLHIKDCYISRTEVVALLRKFPTLVELKLDSVMISDDYMGENDSEILPFPQLNNFRLINTDFFCFLLIQLHENLQSLEITSPLYTRTDVEILEAFLLRQRRLKSLKVSTLRLNSTYSTNRLHQVAFQLETLILDDVVWDIPEHCKQFLLSQTSLRKFGLRSFKKWITPREDMSLWFNEVMKHILIRNINLESVTIDEFGAYSHLKDGEFLIGECNKNVKALEYIRCRTSQTSEFLKISTRIFPNLVTISISLHQEDSEAILGVLSNFPQLKHISIKSKTTALCHLSKETMERVISFKFVCIDEVKACEMLKGILGHNSKMEHLYLNIEPLTFEQIIELIIFFASSLTSLTVFNFYLNSTEAEVLQKNFPKISSITSDTIPNAEIREILSRITFNSIKTDS